MKKNLLALTVAALTAATVASTASAATVYDKDGTSLAVYGRVQSVFYSEHADSTAFRYIEHDTNGKVITNDGSGSLTASGRFGVTVRQQLNPQFAAFANAEWDVADGVNHDSFGARYLQVGVDMGQYGEVKFGRFEEAIKYALFATDIYDDWGCYGYQGNDDRRDGMVQYKWSGYGFDALVSYQFAKANTHVDGAYYGLHKAEKVGGEYVRYFNEERDLSGSFSLAAGYTSPDVLFGPIAVRVGAAWGSFEEDSVETNKFFIRSPNSQDPQAVYDKYTSLAAGVSWGKLNIGPYVGFQFSQRTFDLAYVGAKPANYPDDVTIRGYEFAVGYSFANGVSFRTGVDYIQNDGVVSQGKTEGKVVGIDGGVIPAYLNWQISPNFNVWGEARFDLGSASDENANGSYADLTGANLYENVYSFGVRYTF